MRRRTCIKHLVIFFLVVVVRVELTWGTNPTIIILPRLADTNRLPYACGDLHPTGQPRSVHTHFQGLLRCLWSTVLYTECSSYRTTCVPTSYGFASLRRVTSLPRSVGTFVLPSYTYIIPHTLNLCQPLLSSSLSFFLYTSQVHVLPTLVLSHLLSLSSGIGFGATSNL